MKKILCSVTLTLLGATSIFGQTTIKTYELRAVGEGNFGTPNGDVFFRSTHADPQVISAGLFGTANSQTGIDVLQDYDAAGDKAVLLSKSSGFRIIVANYPSYTQVTQFTNVGAPQSVVAVSNASAYVSCSNPASVQKIDLINNTISAITDAAISNASTSMIASGGSIYIAMGANIVKIDTLTNAVSSFNPQIGTIKNLDYDAATSGIWALGSVSGTSTAIRIDAANGDVLGTPVSFTGLSQARLLRYCNNKLYFWNQKDLYVYDLQTPVWPVTYAYQSLLPGTAGNFGDFGYDRSFGVDKVSGDFVISTANGYAASSLFEVVNGTTFELIDRDTMNGARIVNEVIIKTFTDVIHEAPVADEAELADVTEQCSATLTAPTATAEDGSTVTGTTDETEITEQGTHTITWTYADMYGSSTQEQTVIISDDTDPVPAVATLPVATGTCPLTVTAPAATDNCSGNLTATTTNPMVYSEAGTYTITWTYADANGNSITQQQTVEVTCPSTSGLNELSTLTGLSLYPNPAADVVWIEGMATHATLQITVFNQLGQAVKSNATTGADAFVSLSGLNNGIYYVNIQEVSTQKTGTYKLTIAR